MATTSSEARREFKAARRLASRQAAERRDAARDERDKKLRAAAYAYTKLVQRIWAEWRAS